MTAGTGQLARLDDRTLAAVAAYDARARAYQQSLRLRRPVADIRRFAAFVRRGDLVLDAACGPATDLRLLRDIGVHPVGVDLSAGVLTEARLMMPRHPLVRAPLHDLPFRPRSFGGLWLSAAFDHLPRSTWPETFASLMGLLDHGPVYLSCTRGTADLAEVDDPVLGTIYRSEATEREIATMLAAHGLQDLSVELRPDPIVDRKRPWVVAHGHL